MAVQSKLTCFYHPTKVLFLDDSPEFLCSIEMDLSPELDCVFETSQEKAKKIISASKEDINALLMTTLDDDDTDTIADNLVDFEFPNIINLVYDANRFQYFSVVVVDYDMPEENGIEFCRSIQDKPVLKIMLTAAADQSTAIKAFNEGVIDKFLLKSDDNLNEELIEAIKDMQKKYFNQLSQTTLSNLNSETRGLINTPEYRTVFDEVEKSSNAVEHYLVDSSGSFLFLDESGTPTWLIVRNNDELDRSSEIADGYGASERVRSALKGKKGLLFLLSAEDMKKSYEYWDDYLFETKQLNELAYYSIIKGRTKNLVEWDSLIAYKKH